MSLRFQSHGLRALCIAITGFVFSSPILLAQGVKISSNSGIADPSSILELESSSQGLLAPRLTSAERDNIQSPAEGLLLYNLDTKCYNYFNGTNWLEWCGTCIPQPSVASAGSDQSDVSGTSATLAANTPVSGNGSWSIVSGSGGTFSSSGDPSAEFTGIPGGSYVLRWTISTACGSNSDDVNVSFSVPGIQYANGNEAYWTEKSNGFRDVTIGGGSTVYSWDGGNMVYRNGDVILVPDLISTANGNTVNANTFFGFGIGGSMNGTQFNFDKTPLPLVNRGSNYSAVYDRTNAFVSPLSSFSMSYCRALQNSHSSTCTNSSGTYSINSPTVYPAGPGSGTYTIHQADGKFDAGRIDNGSDNEKIHQQSLESGSYCTTTYGKGWRIPTKMEFGMLVDGASGTPEQIYRDGGGYKSMWTSNYWPTSLPYNKQVAYTNTYDFNTNNPDTPNYVRCIFSVE